MLYYIKLSSRSVVSIFSFFTFLSRQPYLLTTGNFISSLISAIKEISLFTELSLIESNFMGSGFLVLSYRILHNLNVR